MTRLPLLLPLARLLASDCRKVFSCAVSLELALALELEPPPSAVSRFENDDSSAVVESLLSVPVVLLVSLVSAVVLVLVLVELLSAASFCIRLCRSDCKLLAPPGPPTGGGGGAALLSASALEAPSWLCRVLMSVCMKVPSACAILVASVLVEALVSLSLLADEVELDELVDDADSVTPADFSAAAMALMKSLPDWFDDVPPMPLSLLLSDELVSAVRRLYGLTLVDEVELKELIDMELSCWLG